MLEDKFFLDLFEHVLVLHDGVSILLTFEKILPILLLHSLLLHHSSATGHELHLLNGFLVGEKQAKNTIKSVDEQEGP